MNRSPYSVRGQAPSSLDQNFKSSEMQRRPKQISGLHAQFQELKKKIIDVSNKNQKIIQKIHNAFKKKPPCVQNKYQDDQEQYQENEFSQNNFQRINPGYYVNYKVSDQKINDNEGNYRKTMHTVNYQKQKKITQLNNQDSYYNIQNRSSSYTSKSPVNILYRNQGLPILSKQSMIENQKKKLDVSIANQQSSKSTVQKSKNFLNDFQGNRINYSQIAIVQPDKNLINDTYKQSKRKDDEISRLSIIDQKYKNYFDTSKIIFQSGFSNFMEIAIRNNLNVIEKAVKKNQLRLLNLSVMIREAHQDHKSIKVIKDHRRRRSNSRSLHKNDKNDGKKSARSELSKSQVKTQQNAKRNKQFQQIVGKYQQIIRTKNQQIQNLNKKNKEKQQQCYQLKSRIEVIMKKNKQQQTQNNAINTSKNSIIQQQYESKIKEKDSIIQQEKIKNKNFAKKIQQLQNSLNQKSNLNVQLKQVNSSLEQKLNNLKNFQKSNQKYQINIEKLQIELQSKCKVINQLQQNNSEIEKKVMQKECELYGITNKIKKLQQMLDLKQKKTQELQKLLRENQQCMQKSIYGDHNLAFSRIDNRTQDYQRLIEQNQKLHLQIQNKKNETYLILKQKELSDKKVIQGQEKIASLKKKLQSIEQQRVLAKSEHIPHPYQEQQQKKNIQQQLVILQQKCNNFAKTIQLLRGENLQINSKRIKIESQLEFIKESIKEKELLVEKYKRQNDDIRNKIIYLQNSITLKQQEYELSKKAYEVKIHQLQKQWQDFQQNIKQYGINDVERKSQLSIINHKSNHNQLTTQNQYLTEKLKQAEAIIQTQNLMEQKIINEYRNNVERVKSQLRQKNNNIEKLTIQLDKSKKLILQLNSKVKQKQNDYQNENLSQRVVQLQKQLQQSKDINNKLTQMTNELFDQIKSKQTQKLQFFRQIQIKNHRILELQQFIDMQCGSRIIGKSCHRQSLKSQIIKQSHAYYDNNHSHHEGTIDFELSFDQSFLDNSHLNVSELFREMPHDKMKLRKRQHKLFEKTAQYINSLKQSLQEKCKKIRILQKKIQSLKSSELVRKDYDLSGKDTFENDDTQEGDFKDYESVQLDNRKGGQNHRRFKMLENDTKLVVEQNNMLRQQIQALQQQIQRAEEQQNSLVKIKDLYKDEIKKLIKKNQQQTKMYQEQLQKQRTRYQDSESVHNFMALKQLFIKAGVMIGLNGEYKKKEQKKKELEQYIKLMCNILKVDHSQKDQILKSLRTQ